MAISFGVLAGAVMAQPAAEVTTALERAFALDQGTGDKRDAAGAAAAYRIAAAAGDGAAHLRLGQLSEAGDGVPQDFAQARAHYEAAVAAGVNEARLRLAICHLEGWGGPVDRAAFAREVRAAAEASYLPAQRLLAGLYSVGFAVPKDTAQSIAWLERAAAADDAESQVRLGLWTERVRELTSKPDKELARTWYQLSAEQEYTEGMRQMARTFLTGERKERDWAQGRRWLELATEAEDAEAPYLLALFEMLHVDATTRDAGRARTWLQLASHRGKVQATEVLQLEIAGRSLTEAMRYVFSTPFEERYVNQSHAKAPPLDAKGSRPPKVTRVVKPIYPQSLRLSQVAGEAVLEFTVDVTGRVQNAKAVKADHPLFADRAIEAVKQWRFEPGQEEGRLVKVRMRVPVMFRLDEAVGLSADDMLGVAMDLAQRAGPAAVADAVNLRIAYPLGPIPRPRSSDGVAIKQAKVLLLLVLNKEGRPVRGHVLDATPTDVGPVFLAIALQHTYRPDRVDGTFVESNVVFPMAIGYDNLIRPTP